MTKQYLIPIEVVMEGDMPVNVPKYIYSMGISWAGTHFGEKDLYLITAELTTKQHKDITKNIDVIDLSNNDKKTRDSITNLVGVDTKSTDDLVYKIIKSKDEKASSSDLKISEKA